MLISSCRPVTMVDDAGYRESMRRCDPKFIITDCAVAQALSVLTATHHSYGSPRLSDFFSLSALGVRSLNGHSRKMAQTTCFHARMCLLQ